MLAFAPNTLRAALLAAALAALTHGTGAAQGASGPRATDAAVCEDAMERDLAHELAHALHAVSDATWRRHDDFMRRELELSVARQGLSLGIGLRPSIGIGHDLDTAEGVDALDLIGYQVDASVGYRHDEVAVVRAEAALAAAGTRLAERRRDDVLEALVAMSRLRVAERAESAASAELADALAALARAEETAAREASSEGADAARAPEDAPDPPLFLREARLAARRAEAALADARGAVDAQLAVLDALGVGAAGEEPHAEQGCAPPALALPAADGAAAERARAPLEIALRLAEAQLRRAALGPLRDLSLQAQYQEGGGRATAHVGLASGRPEAGLALRWRPTGTDGWSVRLGANIQLDEGLGRALAQAEEAVVAARADLSAFDARRPGEVAASLAALERAWLEVELLSEALQIALARRDSAEPRTLLRDSQAVLRALDARERGLQAYYRAYAAHLGVVGADWPGR